MCRDARGLIGDLEGGRCSFRTKAPAGQLHTALGDRYLRGTRAAIDIELRAEVFQEHVIRNDAKWPGRIVANVEKRLAGVQAHFARMPIISNSKPRPGVENYR